MCLGWLGAPARGAEPMMPQNSTTRPVAAASAAAAAPAAVEFTPQEIERIRKHSPLPPVPDDGTNRFATDERAARLGQFLFFDPALSANGKISCATCHDPALGFGDGKKIFEGLGPGERHTQALWNVAYNRWYFWDGRADSLWSQAIKPLENPIEMGFSRVDLVRRIAADDRLRAAYVAIFGALPDVSDEQRFPRGARPLSERPSDPGHKAWSAMRDDDKRAVNGVLASAGKALAAYERKLVSHDAPFDRFVAGLADGDAAKLAALSESARRGLRLFVGKANCRACHGGPNFSDGEFHNNRIRPLEGGALRDPGRYRGLTQLRADVFDAAGEFSDERHGPAAERLARLAGGPQTWGQFKTPSLRSVARTAPYMHQGQFATLADVLRFYSTLEGAAPADHHPEKLLSPLKLSAEEQGDLIAFLESLTGAPLAEELLVAPDAP